MKRASLTAAFAFAVLTAGVTLSLTLGGVIGPQRAEAQNIGQRVVSGTLLDADSVPVIGATVFLKDLKSKTIRSFTTIDKGHFRFAQVTMAEDHDLWAEKDGKKTAVKSVSSWDTRKDFEVELKLK